MPQALAQNQQLAGYEILALVGKGGMGEVYRARQLSMDRIVALKVLALHHAKNDPFTKSFVEEARAAGRLSHPNIVSVHDVGSTTLPGTSEQVYYFSMEFIEGESLKDVMAREGRCPDDLIGVVMNGMAEALTYAEKVGIVHRDIKPDNVMLTKDKLVKLADLGLAMRMGEEQVADEGAGADPHARSKVMGTPMYMSPEQARAGKIDHRSDQYSLGATLFHLLTGHPPYRGTDARAIMRSHVFDPVPDPRDVRADVPDTWRQLCMRLMAKTPEERFATAADLRAAVYAANHGVALSSFSRRAPRIPRRLTRSSRTHQLLAVLAALLVLGGGAALALGGNHGHIGAAPTPNEHVTTALPAPNTGGGGDIDLSPLRAQLATLPADPRAALAAIEELRHKPEWTPSLAHNLLEEAARRYAGQIEQARADDYQREHDVLAALISSGRLAEAGSQLSIYLEGHREAASRDQFKEIQALLAKACASLASSFRDRVARAGSSAEIDVILAEAKGAPISSDDAKSIEALAARHRGELENERDRERHQAIARAWQGLALDCDQARRSLNFAGFDEIIDRHAKDFPADDPAAQKRLAALKDLSQLASVGEMTMKGWVRSHHPEVEALIKDQPARVQLVGWGAGSMEYRTMDEGEKGEPHSVPRGQFRLRGAGKLLVQAIAGDPRAGADLGRITAACLWMWRQDGAFSAAQSLGASDFGQALAELIRGYDGDLGLNGIAVRDQDSLAVSYDFSDKDESLLHDFEGAALTMGDHGLVWTSTAAVPTPSDGVGLESSLPQVAWHGQLSPPLTVDALVWLHPAMALAMVGLEQNGRRIRVGISHDRFTEGHVTDRFGVVITSDDGVHFQSSQLNEHDQIGLWDPEKPLHLSLSMQESGQVAASLNDAPLGTTYIGALPNGPTRVVLETFQPNGQTVLEISALTIRGKIAAR